MLDTEIKLVTSTKDREHYDSLAEIYAVLTSLEFLERAYLRDSIQHTQYTPTCLRLLAQYNGIVGSNPALLGDTGIEGFRDRYSISATHAISRLKIGVPATVEHAIMENTGAGSNSSTGNNSSSAGGMGASARAVAEATGVSIPSTYALFNSRHFPFVEESLSNNHGFFFFVFYLHSDDKNRKYIGLTKL